MDIDIDRCWCGCQPTPPALPDHHVAVIAAREDHILFFDAANDAPYGFAVEVLDQARAGGAVAITALTSPLEAPSGS